MTENIVEELLDLEHGFWTGGAAYYRAHADETCLVAFPGMVGALSNEELAATVKDGTRWQNVNIDMKGRVQPSDGVVILSYAATAERDGERYKAAVSSAYVRRKDGWKLAFHQHTPG